MEGTLERKHKLQLGGKKVNITITDIFLTPTTTNKHLSRAVTIHQTHDSVRITIFSWGVKKKKKIFKTIFFIK